VFGCKSLPIPPLELAPLAATSLLVILLLLIGADGRLNAVSNDPTVRVRPLVGGGEAGGAALGGEADGVFNPSTTPALNASAVAGEMLRVAAPPPRPNPPKICPIIAPGKPELSLFGLLVSSL